MSLSDFLPCNSLFPFFSLATFSSFGYLDLDIVEWNKISLCSPLNTYTQRKVDSYWRREEAALKSSKDFYPFFYSPHFSFSPSAESKICLHKNVFKALIDVLSTVVEVIEDFFSALFSVKAEKQVKWCHKFTTKINTHFYLNPH